MEHSPNHLIGGRSTTSHGPRPCRSGPIHHTSVPHETFPAPCLRFFCQVLRLPRKNPTSSSSIDDARYGDLSVNGAEGVSPTHRFHRGAEIEFQRRAQLPRHLHALAFRPAHRAILIPAAGHRHRPWKRKPHHQARSQRDRLRLSFHHSCHWRPDTLCLRGAGKSDRS